MLIGGGSRNDLAERRSSARRADCRRAAYHLGPRTIVLADKAYNADRIREPIQNEQIAFPCADERQEAGPVRRLGAEGRDLRSETEPFSVSVFRLPFPQSMRRVMRGSR